MESDSTLIRQQCEHKEKSVYLALHWNDSQTIEIFKWINEIQLFY